MLGEQHRAFVARTNEAHLQRISLQLFVAEVRGPQAGRPAGNRPGEKRPPRKADGLMKVVLAQTLLFGGELHGVILKGEPGAGAPSPLGRDRRNQIWDAVRDANYSRGGGDFGGN